MTTYIWESFEKHPPEVQEHLLREMKLETNLLQMTWKGQVSTLAGAPGYVLLKYLPHVYWKAQVRIYEDHLPVALYDKAKKLLDVRAKIELKLIARKPNKMFAW